MEGLQGGRELKTYTEFGKDYGTYFTMLSSIAAGRNSRSEIEAAVGGGEVGGYIRNLEREYELITSAASYRRKTTHGVVWWSWFGIKFQPLNDFNRNMRFPSAASPPRASSASS